MCYYKPFPFPAVYEDSSRYLLDIGDISFSQIAEAGEDSLPPWMHFNEELKALQGIASTDDIGRQFLMEVTAISQFTNDTLSHAKDIFAVNVAEDNVHSQTTATPLKVTAFIQIRFRPFTLKVIEIKMF